MNPQELEHQLPNGFHGAILDGITVDYVNRIASFNLRILVPRAPEKPIGDSRFRRSIVHIHSLAFFACDVPDPTYNYDAEDGLELGSLVDTTEELCPNLHAFQRELGEDSFINSFFVEELNGFIHFAGKSATLDWIEK